MPGKERGQGMCQKLAARDPTGADLQGPAAPQIQALSTAPRPRDNGQERDRYGGAEVAPMSGEDDGATRMPGTLDG
jgi:hypothetical protein